MNKQVSLKYCRTISILILVVTLFLANVGAASAEGRGVTPTALPNPGAVLPIPVSATGKYSQGAHKSGFKMGYITNPGVQYSSIDIGYSGTVVAPIAGTLAIAVDCGDHQIAFIRGNRGSDGYGWAAGLTHIYVNTAVRNKTVTQGQVIGKTVPPPAYPGKGCGYGSGSHIHYTLMRWKMGSKGPLYTEQSIVNTYLAQWIVKSTYLDGPRNDVPTGGMIRDLAKITSVRSGKVIDAYSSGIQIWTFSSTNQNQQWVIIYAPNDPGYVYLKSLSRNKCIYSPNGANGSLIPFTTCGAENQKVKFIAIPNLPGKVAIRFKTSGKVLDVITNWNDPNSGKANGTRIQQWAPFYGDNQQWVVSKP